MNTIVSRLQKEREELLRDFKDIKSPPLKSTALSSGDWTDEDLGRLTEGLGIPAHTHRQEYLIMSRFYEFYLGGKARRGDNNTATIVEAIFLLRESGERVFQPNEIAVTWYNANRSEEGYNDTFTRRFDDFAVPTSVVDEDEIQAYRALLGEYNEETMATFADYVKERLELFLLHSAELDVEDLQFLQLTAMLAMVTLRSMNKEEVTVRNAYAKQQFRLNLGSLIGFDSSFQFSPPCKEFTKAVFADFSVGSASARRLVALLVRVHLASSEESRDAYISGILTASCLMHLSNTGLGMMQLVAQAEEATARSWKDIFELTYTSHTKASWTRILAFTRENLGVTGQKSKVLSWPWSRVMADTYNKGLSTKENRALACTLGAIAEKVCGTGIWTAKWIEGYLDQYQAFRQHGYVVFQALLVTPEAIMGELDHANQAMLEAVQQDMKQKGAIDRLLGSRPQIVRTAPKAVAEEEEEQPDPRLPSHPLAPNLSDLTGAVGGALPPVDGDDDDFPYTQW